MKSGNHACKRSHVRIGLYGAIVAFAALLMVAWYGSLLGAEGQISADGSAAEQNDEVWQMLPVPGAWETAGREGLKHYDGIAWYRCAVTIPAAWMGRDPVLYVEKIGDAHEAYFNGARIGSAGKFPPEHAGARHESRHHLIPASSIHLDRPNLLAIRVHNLEGRGGFLDSAPAIISGFEAIVLEGDWQFRTGDDQAWAVEGEDFIDSGASRFADLSDAALLKAHTMAFGATLDPAEALERMSIPDDLELETVLAEPTIAQPLSMKFDHRGRLWLVEFRQYPSPAGLKITSRDKFWRMIYDRVPPPPPYHDQPQFRGRDRISIHEDTDGDGAFENHKVFLDGLSMATSFAFGRGGVWVLCPPYLLFYPDRDGDDLPDGDPEVHLEGFGLEDTHGLANSLRRGPDGWLYGAQGSNSTSNVKRYGIDENPVHTKGQHIWRYHPATRRHEIFAEGGGNAFGVEIDAKGRIYSGYNGGNTRGFHYVQGGYYYKGFQKHGQLSNPYTFGYFPFMRHEEVPRFTHSFVIYEANTLPKRYHGKLFGVDPINRRVVYSDVSPDSSTFKTRDLGDAIVGNDEAFRPVDIKVGPGGAIYVADFYDRQITHMRHHVGQIDGSTGRIYRLKSRGAEATTPFDLSSRSHQHLMEILRGHPNKWHRQTALRLIADRRDKAMVSKETIKGQGQGALEALWALYQIEGIREGSVFALGSLEHEDPHVRAWTVRLLCDPGKVTDPTAARLTALCRSEPHAEVRSQLACSARRLETSHMLPMIRCLLRRDEDTKDVHIPLLLWWALEAKCTTDPEAVVGLFEDANLWRLPMVQQHILERLMRRFAAAGTRRDLSLCARLLDQAPDADSADRLLAGFEKAFEGRAMANLPEPLYEAMARHGGGSVALQLRRGVDEAVAKALRIVADENANHAERLQYIAIFGQLNEPACVEALLEVAGGGGDFQLRTAALTALQRYDRPEIGSKVIDLYVDLPAEVRPAAQILLASRGGGSLQWLVAVDEGRIDLETIPLEVVRQMTHHRQKPIDLLVETHWGSLYGATTAQMSTQIDRLQQVIQSGTGHPAEGKKLYMNSCGKCHRLFTEGGQIGPDLSVYKRDDLETMLLHIVNPSAEIREGYESAIIETTDHRTLSGFVADQDDRIVVVRSLDGQNVVIARAQIHRQEVSSLSLMPEGLLDGLDDQQVRNLFAYLRSTLPLN